MFSELINVAADSYFIAELIFTHGDVFLPLKVPLTAVCTSMHFAKAR